jgi:hypothetical protein
MNVKLISLDEWIERQYKSYPSMSPVDRKNDAAEILGCGISTLYRWLKSGNVYVEEYGSDHTGDGGGIMIWRHGEFLS